MSTDTTMSVFGTDGHVPIYDTSRRWTIWALHEIYTGAIGLNKYVPNVRDWVYDADTGEQYHVVSVDSTTLVAQLVKMTGVATGTDLTADELLMGPDGGAVSDTYRIYVDKSVVPNTLTVDTRLQVGGSTTKYAQIVKGSKLDGSAVVVSAFYDPSGTLLGQNIPLELVANYKLDNRSLKIVPPCYASQDIANGEVLTVMIYRDDGGLASIRQLMAVESTVVRQTDTSQKYITGISLESPFISDTDRKQINYPLNVPLNGLNLFGVVSYSDGSSLRMPVDNTKFQVFGLEKFLSTVVGQKLPVVLKYNLSPGEIKYDATAGADDFITETYSLTTVKADGTYSMKLYAYPVWVDAINGYRLDWWMLNLDRREYYRVTPNVRINENTAAFNPILYGANQRLSVSINLRDVNGTFKNYIHTQTIDITLLRPGMDHTGTDWTVAFELSQNPPYGRELAVGMKFINQNLKHLDLSLGETQYPNWLERVFKQTKPLYNPGTELASPEPNMFLLVLPNGQSYEYKIEQWNSDIVIGTDIIPDSSTIFLLFFKRTPETDFYLSVAGLPVFQSVGNVPL